MTSKIILVCLAAVAACAHYALASLTIGPSYLPGPFQTLPQTTYPGIYQIPPRRKLPGFIRPHLPFPNHMSAFCQQHCSPQFDFPRYPYQPYPMYPGYHPQPFGLMPNTVPYRQGPIMGMSSGMSLRSGNMDEAEAENVAEQRGSPDIIRQEDASADEEQAQAE